MTVLVLLHHAGRKEWVGESVCWLPFIFVWSLFPPDDLELTADPECCPRSWVGEKDLRDCFFPMCTIRQGGSTFTKQAEFPDVGVALVC